MPGIIVNNSLGHVFNLSASNNIIPIHAIFCKPFIVQISFNGTMINTSIFNITPEDGKLEGSWKQYALTNNETGTVTHHCNFETLTGSDCKLSVVGSYQNSAGRCTYKRGIGDSSLNFLKSDSSYTLQCLDQSGYTEVSSILHNTGIFQTFLSNSFCKTGLIMNAYESWLTIWRFLIRANDVLEGLDVVRLQSDMETNAYNRKERTSAGRQIYFHR
ncbi:hypothetical protein Smp_154480 [Schistosoma mansoni]|uniref:hypothetical protein n=1 Tax=Schistosoma mansoni TaxID=6183 RepID=UPI00022DCC69|nr:hypothetical protein Smp_154480 [Schistosoma mansoni]|eukprot:XP_018655168.1 hypothetical protein Smp_154480 [Schistosoma mansoni]